MMTQLFRNGVAVTIGTKVAVKSILICSGGHALKDTIKLSLNCHLKKSKFNRRRLFPNVKLVFGYVSAVHPERTSYFNP